MKKVLVTGGLGFIGSWLTDFLIEQDVEVVILDNCTTNAVPPIRNGGCTTIISGISPISLMSVDGIDTVFHLASFVGPVGILKHAGRMGYGIISDTIQIIDFCLNRGALLIDVSTSEIYGTSGVFTEASKKVFPANYAIRTEYGAGKMLSEMAVCNTAKVEPLKYHIIRPFNITGPRQKPDGGFVLPRFVIAALTHQPITVYGDGTQERAFTDVRDISSVIIDIANLELSNEVWNIGNIKNRTTIGNLAIMVKEESERRGVPAEIQFVDPRTLHGENYSEVDSKIPDSSKLIEKLKWEPKYTFEQTISDLFDYYSDKLKKGYYFNVWNR